MSKGSKFFLGICTFLPFVFGILCLFYYISIVFELVGTISSIDDPREFLPVYFSKVFSWQLWTLVAGSLITHLSLMIYYIIHVVKNERKSEGLKIMWILLFIFIGAITYVIYFFVKIVPEKPEHAAISKT